MPDGERLDPRPRYDPYAFPETGPDHGAIRLRQQGAPGGPPADGTCTVAVARMIGQHGEVLGHYALAKQCRLRSRTYLGAIKVSMPLAELAADRMDGHICA